MAAIAGVYRAAATAGVLTWGVVAASILVGVGLMATPVVLLNIKGADEAGHDGKGIQKRDFIEVIDAALEPLLDREDILLVVCADHSTPCSIKDHSADPVPVVIRGPGVRVDRVRRFDEVSCAEGGLHRIRGSDLMPIIMDLINKSHKYGA